MLKYKFKLPKVLNKQPGKPTSSPFNFSWANWGSESLAYRDAVLKHGAAWLRDLFIAAQSVCQLTSSNISDEAGEAVDPRSLLCMFFTFLFRFPVDLALIPSPLAEFFLTTHHPCSFIYPTSTYEQAQYLHSLFRLAFVFTI